MGTVTRGRRPRRWVAGFLSAVVPGLGQLYSGRTAVGLAFLGPTIAVAAVLAFLVLRDPSAALLRLLDPQVLLLVLVGQAVLLLWRLAAVASAVGSTPPVRTTARDGLIALLLVAFVVLPHAGAGYLTTLARGSVERIFVADRSPGPGVDATAVPQATGAAGSPALTPEPATTPDWSTGDRVTVLLIGVDSAPGRTQALTDTILVASYDPLGNTVSVLSVPRDLVDVPLPNGRVYRPKINSLASFVERNAGDFAWAGGSGPRVLAAALGEMLGTPIHYWAEVDMGGFVNLVDALGGIDVHATTALDAPGYRAYGVDGFAITPGVHHLDGGHSLAYARIRKAAGESDFTRAARQQEILVAVRDRIASGGFLADLPGFLDAVGQTVRTDMPADRLPLLASRIGDVGRRDVYRAVITPPLVRFGSDERGSILIPDQEAIRDLADQLFTPPGGTPSAGAAGDG